MHRAGDRDSYFLSAAEMPAGLKAPVPCPLQGEDAMGVGGAVLADREFRALGEKSAAVRSLPPAQPEEGFHVQ